jgi:ERCC4-type nuclease
MSGKASNTVPLVVMYDYREESSEVPMMLKKLGLPTRPADLPCDYVIGGVGIERKTIEDYLQSKLTGHLDKQLYLLSRNFELSYLFVEGYVSEALIRMKLNRHMYLSSLIGSSLKRAPDGKQGQIITVNVETKYDTALAIKFLHDKLAEGKLTRLPKIETYKPKEIDLAVYILSAFPGIGEARAKALLERFGTLRSVFSSRDWTVVKGIGRRLNDEIQNLLDKKFGGGG